MKKVILILSIFFSIVFVLAVLGGWFYWYEWRPNEVRKGCYRELVNWTKGNEDDDEDLTDSSSSSQRSWEAFYESRGEDIELSDEASEEQKKKEDKVYRDCLRSQGLGG